MKFNRDFKNKKEKEEYLLICETIWGCWPKDIDWATQTKVYEKTHKKLIESGVNINQMSVSDLFNIIKL